MKSTALSFLIHFSLLVDRQLNRQRIGTNITYVSKSGAAVKLFSTLSFFDISLKYLVLVCGQKLWEISGLFKGKE